jgi:hypothetical protein
MMCAVIGAIGLIWLVLATILVGIGILISKNKPMIMTKKGSLEICG